MRIKRGWIVQAWKKSDLDARIIRLQKLMIYLLFSIILLLSIGWATAPSRLVVYIPPDIQNGATFKAGSIPDSLIYSFAYQIWQEINYWPDDLGEDYKKNILRYRFYLTQKFKENLLTNNSDLTTSGQLNRIRYLQGLNGAAYDVTNVKKISSNSWEVDLRMRLTEFKNNQIVKDVEILYPIKVVKHNVSVENNPYGLALAGFISSPVRFKSYI